MGVAKNFMVPKHGFEEIDLFHRNIVEFPLESLHYVSNTAAMNDHLLDNKYIATKRKKRKNL